MTVPDSGYFSVSEGIDELLKILEAFSFESTYEEGYNYVNEDFYVGSNDYSNTFEFLKSNNIIKEKNSNMNSVNLNSYQLSKYDRQIKSFASLANIEVKDALKMQKKICDSKIVIIGIGGTGSYLALSMANIGVGELVLVDKDEIELSNTSRQILYDEDDVGKQKIDVAKLKLQRYSKDLKVTTYSKYINSVNDFDFLDKHKDADLIVLCADTPRLLIHYYMDEAAKKYNIPWFAYGPYHHSKVVIGPLIIPDKTKTYSELFPKSIVSEDKRIKLINGNFIAAVSDPFNGLASKIASVEILKYLTNYSEVEILNTRLIIDTDNWYIEKRYYE